MNVLECKERVKALLAVLDKLPDDAAIIAASVQSFNDDRILLRDGLLDLAASLSLEVTARTWPGDKTAGPCCQLSAMLDDVSLVYIKRGGENDAVRKGHEDQPGQAAPVKGI